MMLQQLAQGLNATADAADRLKNSPTVVVQIRIENDLADRLDRQLEDRLLTTLRKRIQ